MKGVRGMGWKGERRWLMFVAPAPVYAKFGWADGEDDG